MVVEVNKNLQEYIEQKVASGEYSSKDELINEALALHLDEHKKAVLLEEALQKGLDDIENNSIEQFTSNTVDQILQKVIAKNA